MPQTLTRRIEACLQKTTATRFKLQRGPKEEGSVHPPIGSYGPSPSGCQGLRSPCNSPLIFWNDDPWGQWLGPENLGYAILDGQCTHVLINNGTRTNTVMPAYVRQHNLEMGPITQLQSVTWRIPIHGVRGARTGPMGYVVMRVQVEGVPSYGEDQVFLVIDDNSAYSRWVPVILSTPTINRVVMAMRESEMSTAPPEWQYSRRSYEFANRFFMGMVGAESEEGALGFAMNTAISPTNLDEKIKLKDGFAVPAFGMLVLHGWTERTMNMLQVITQAPYPEDQINGLYVLSTYTQLNPGSHNVAVVVCSGTSRAICMPGGYQIGRVITANAIPDPHASPDLLKKLDKEELTPTPGLTVAEHQEKFMETLEKDRGLDALKIGPWNWSQGLIDC